MDQRSHHGFLSWSVQEFAQELAKRDPGQATNWLAENVTGEALDQALGGSISLWLASDFEAATTYLKQIEDKSRLAKIVEDSLWQVAYSDPAKTVGLLKLVGEENFGDWVIDRLLTSVSQLDVPGALNLAKSFQSDETRYRGISQVLGHLAFYDPDKALSEASQIKLPAAKSAILGVILEKISLNDPQLALQKLKSLPESEQSREVVASVYEGWSRHHPKEAAEAALEIENPVIREAAVKAALDNWWQGGKAAAQFVLALPPSKVTEDAIGHHAATWATSDPEEALAMARTLPNDSISRNFTQSVIGAMARNDPAFAAEALTDGSLTASPPQAHGVVAAAWAERDPTAAANWASTIVGEQDQANALTSIVETWAKDDPQATATFLEGLSEGSPRDKAVHTYAGQMASIDPVSSISWSQTIGNQDQRWKSTKTILHQWHGREAEAAQRWMAENRLTREQIEEVMKVE